MGLQAAAAAQEREAIGPLGVARGIHAGRVAWVHDPEVTDWRGPGDGHWWEGSHVNQERVDAMLAHAVCELTGEAGVPGAWAKLFRYLNQLRGKGDVGYQAGERVAIKPNWVGMIYREGHVNLETCTFIRRHDYMNTAPQMILALLRQLTSVGVSPANITVSDTLACLVSEFHGILHPAFPEVRFEDYAGKLGPCRNRPPACAARHSRHRTPHPFRGEGPAAPAMSRWRRGR